MFTFAEKLKQMSNIAHKDVGVSSLKGTPSKKIYIKTSTEAVYNPEGVTQEYINNHVDGSKIVSGTITNNKIADSTISMGKLDNDVQTKIQQGTQRAWTPKGAYDAEAVYDVNDLVYHTDTNSSYISLQANNQGHNPAWQSATGGWWMKVLDGSYVNVMVEELEQAIAQAIEDAQQDISGLISDSQATIDAAVSGANSAAQAANDAAANAEAKIDWVEEQVDSLTAYEVATALDETSIIPVQNKVVTEAINALSENLQDVEEENTSYRLIYNDELFSFSTTSSSKSKYYIREIPFEAGKTYRVTFTLDAAKSNKIDLYLANQTTVSSTLARILIGSMQAGETSKTIIYTCNDATMIFPSIYIASATSGSFVIVVEEVMPANDAIEATNDRIDDTTIIKEEVVTDGIIEFSGLGISATTWTQETQRTLQAISVKDVARVTITASDTNPAYYCFLTSLERGVGVPVYYCRGYHSYTSIGAGTTATIDVPPLAQYILINKSYGNVVYAPKSVSVARKTNALTLASSLMVDSIDGDDYDNRHWTINTSNVWGVTTGSTYSKFIPLQAGTYKIDAVNGIAIYAVLNSVNPVDGATPDWATGYGQRYSIAYGGTAQITAQDGWWLVVRADDGVIPSPSGARTPAITNLSVSKIDTMQLEIDANKKPSKTIIIAASDSSDADKKRADLVCTGTDDNKVIESAINMLDTIGTIYLCDGSYYVTSFTQDTDGTYVGITIPGINSTLKTVNIEGYQFGGAFHQSVKIIVPQSVYDTLDSNANYSIIRHKFGTNGYNLGYLLSLRHLSIVIYSNQKKTIAVDCICSGQITMEDCKGIITTQPGVWGAGDSGLDPIPSLDCVFFKGLFGSAHAFAKISNCMATGYGIGFGIQGEHIISESCASINCVYGFAFNYFPDLNHGSGVPGMYTHPMMIINPIEEGCLNFPYFGNNTLKQSIIITGYHNELRPKFFNQGGNYATEKVAGTWYGHVDYVIQFFPDSHSHGNEPHVVDKPFWANGSGINMESQNYAQKRLVTTTERLTYAPNYFQQVFDTTANKLLICTDPANKVWVDADGVQV